MANMLKVRKQKEKERGTKIIKPTKQNNRKKCELDKWDETVANRWPKHKKERKNKFELKR